MRSAASYSKRNRAQSKILAAAERLLLPFYVRDYAIGSRSNEDAADVGANGVAGCILRFAEEEAAASVGGCELAPECARGIDCCRSISAYAWFYGNGTRYRHH